MPPRPPMSQVLDVPPPLGGLNVSDPFSGQDPGTTPTAVNVRGFDASSGRRRLTRRAGLAKYVQTQLLSSNAIQELNDLVGTAYVAGTGLFIPGSATYLVGTIFFGATGASGPIGVSVAGGAPTYFGTAGDTVGSIGQDGSNVYVYSTAPNGAQGLFGYITKYNAAGQQQWRRTLWTATGDVTHIASAGFTPAPVVSGGNVYVNVGAVQTTGGVTVDLSGLYRIKASDGTDTSTNPWITGAALDTAGGGSNGYPSDQNNTPPVVAGGQIALPVEGADDVGLAYVNVSTGALTSFKNIINAVTGSPSQTPPIIDVMASDGTNFYGGVRYATSPGGPGSFNVLMAAKITPAGGLLWTVPSLATGTHSTTMSGDYMTGVPSFALGGGSFNFSLNPSTGATLGTSGPFGGVKSLVSVGAGQYAGATSTSVFFGDGATPAWTVTGLSVTGFISALPSGSSSSGGAVIADTGGLTSYNRAVSLVGVAGGTVKVLYNGAWQNTVNGSGALNAVVARVRSTVVNGKLYFADGTNWKYYDPNDNTVHAWAATAGILPVDSFGNKPRLICTWRGRIVLSGLVGDPQDWFMSRVAAPTDFNYNPSPTDEDQAVAGNNTPAGVMTDIVTALIPYNDDVMIFGGDHTLYQMTGDPAAGGRIDLISDVTGIAWGDAWCKSSDGTVYFFGSRGSVYKFAPGTVPLRISQPIDESLAVLDYRNYCVRMAFDDRWQGVHVFITPLAGGAATHFYYDLVTSAWWSDKFPNLLNPFAILVYDGTPTERAVLHGGQDGYVRYLLTTAPDDDGTPITSNVLCGPLTGGRSVMAQVQSTLSYRGSGLPVRVSEIQVTLANAEGSVNWGIQPGNYAEAAANAAATISGLSGAGRNHSQQVRVAGAYVYVSLSRAVSEPPWSLEALRMTMTPLGKVRQRYFQ